MRTALGVCEQPVDVLGLVRGLLHPALDVVTRRGHVVADGSRMAAETEAESAATDYGLLAALAIAFDRVCATRRGAPLDLRIVVDERANEVL